MGPAPLTSSPFAQLHFPCAWEPFEGQGAVLGTCVHVFCAHGPSVLLIKRLGDMKLEQGKSYLEAVRDAS